MSNRSLAETLIFVNLLLVSGLSVRACSGVHDRVRGCSGTVRVPFGLCSGTVRVMFGLWYFRHFLLSPKSNTVYTLVYSCIRQKPIDSGYCIGVALVAGAGYEHVIGV